MLDVAKILRQKDDRFDTVVFFDETPEDIVETQKRIPGAIGFPGTFTDIVLLEDPDEDSVIDGLDPPPGRADDRGERDRQKRLSMRRDLIRSFPFDVLNLDLYDFLFRPTDPPPGRLIAALRKMCSWQKRAIEGASGANRHINSFSLMFTTRIGPPNINAEYMEMLRERIHSNLQDVPNLVGLLETRSGVRTVTELEAAGFDLFFKLAMPKLLTAMFMEEDWHIDSTNGIVTYEFERVSGDARYKMLHLVMDIRRIDPPKELRAPGFVPPNARDAYRTVVQQIFERPEVVITNESVDRLALEENLRLIQSRRNRYYPEGAGLR